MTCRWLELCATQHGVTAVRDTLNERPYTLITRSLARMIRRNFSKGLIVCTEDVFRPRKTQPKVFRRKTVGRLATITLHHAAPRAVTLAAAGEQAIVGRVALGPFGTFRTAPSVLHTMKSVSHS